jgi:predicted HTH domain antitoxin
MVADLIISGEVLEKSQITAEQLLLEIAIYMYAQQRMSIGQAQRLAKTDRITFQKALAARNICIHFDIDELYDDIQTLGLPKT